MGVVQVLTLLTSLLSVAAGYILRIPVLYPMVPVGIFPPMNNALQPPRSSLVKIENHNGFVNQGKLRNAVAPGPLGPMGGMFGGVPEISLPAGLIMAQGGFSDGSTDFPVFNAPNIEWVWPKGEKSGLPSVMNAGDTKSKASGSAANAGIPGGAGAAGVVFGGPVLSG